MKTFSYKNQNFYAHILYLLIIVVSSNAHTLENNSGAISVSTVNKRINRTLSKVNITIIDRNDNSQTYQVDDKGQLLITDLTPGLYTVKAMKDGFITVIEPSVRVTAGKVTGANLQLPPSKKEIEEVNVIGNKSARSASNPISTSYMNREALRSSPGGGSDVLRALDGMPGLTSTGEFASFSVRGRGPEDNLIYVDNMPFDKVVHFDSSLGELEEVGGGGRFSIFAPNLIEGAEFSPGGWGAAYGGKAGSLLKLDVIDGAQTAAASLRIDLTGLEVGYEGPSGLHSDTSIVFNARNLDFGRFYDALGENDVGDPSLSDILFKSVSTINNNNSIELLLLHSPEEYRRDVENVAEDEDLEENITYRDQKSSLSGLTWHTLIGQQSELSTNFYYRSSDKFTSQGEAYPDLVEPDAPYQEIPVRRDILTLAEEESEIGFRADFMTFNRLGELSLGIDVRQFDLTFDTILREEWQRFIYEQDDFRENPEQKYIVLRPENINSRYDINATSYSAYIDQAFERDSWQLNFGVRHDYDDLSEKSFTSPRLNIAWSPTAGAQYTFSSGIYYQAPSFLDRASDPQNAKLQNEKISHISLGGNWRLSRHYNFLAEAYYQKLDDLVVDSNRTDGLLSNNGEGESLGMDMVLTRYFSNNWSAIATYSFNDSTLNNNDGEGEYDADYNRPHVFSLGAQWEINQRWKLGARWKYLTGTPTDDYIIHDDVLSDGALTRYSQEYISNNTERFGNINQLNVRVDYYRTFGPVNVIAFLDVINLLGTSVDGEVSFDAKTGRLIEEDGDRLPIIGLKFEMIF